MTADDEVMGKRSKRGTAVQSGPNWHSPGLAREDTGGPFMEEGREDMMECARCCCLLLVKFERTRRGKSLLNIKRTYVMIDESLMK